MVGQLVYGQGLGMGSRLVTANLVPRSDYALLRASPEGRHLRSEMLSEEAAVNRYYRQLSKQGFLAGYSHRQSAQGIPLAMKARSLQPSAPQNPSAGEYVETRRYCPADDKGSVSVKLIHYRRKGVELSLATRPSILAGESSVP